MNEDSELWDYSLTIYAKRGVESYCLKLQDDFALNVNFLLFCCWLGETGVQLDEDEMAALLANGSAWQRDVVKPLRASRRALKGYNDVASANLREDLKQVELAAERIELTRLQNATVELTTHALDVADTATRTDRLLTTYASCAKLELTAALKENLLLLRKAVLAQP